jgi:hypothetical protein
MGHGPERSADQDHTRLARCLRRRGRVVGSIILSTSTFHGDQNREPAATTPMIQVVELKMIAKLAQV